MFKKVWNRHQRSSPQEHFGPDSRNQQLPQYDKLVKDLLGKNRTMFQETPQNNFEELNHPAKSV